MATKISHDKSRTEPHPISDSESEASILSVKKKRPARKTKMAAENATPELAGNTSPSKEVTPSSSMAADLAEMRKLCAEIKEASARNTATLSEFKEFKEVQGSSRFNFTQPQSQTTGTYLAEDEEEEDAEMAEPHYTDESHMEFTPMDYPQQWEQEEDDITSVDCMQLTDLQAAISSLTMAAEGNEAIRNNRSEVMGHVGNGAAMTPQGITTTIKVIKENEVATTTTTAKSKPKLFKLDAALSEGALHDQLKEVYKKVKKPVVDKLIVDQNLAGAVKHFYGYNKPIKVIKELSRQYTGLADIPEAQIQLLNDEIKFQEARKLGEDAMLWATKGVVGALTAILPTMAVILTRGKQDSDLDEQAVNMFNAVRMLVSSHVQLTNDRMTNVNKVVNTSLGKDIIKRKKDEFGDKPTPTKYLLGEDLGERNKVALKNARASDNCMNTFTVGRGRKRPYDYQGRDAYPKRARGAQAFRGHRGNVHQQRVAFNHSWNPKPNFQQHRFGRSNDDYAQHGHAHQANRCQKGRGANNQQGNSQRGFQK